MDFIIKLYQYPTNVDIFTFGSNAEKKSKSRISLQLQVRCTWALPSLVGAPSEGGGALQALGLGLEDGGGQLLQAAAQQVGGLLGPLVPRKLLASR